ncbi:MAG: hypothetical protein JO292_05340 [Betaproteobacteria bacterium]|nr:hypothetical protein [Betaproteobacteria bacterium]MBV9360795.1 hypothetical protein [Betaproteobacteria bacterium]
MLINGKCHCGNIAFTLQWDPDPTEIPARACDCTFCQKHGGVWTSNPGGVLRVVVRDPTQRRPYQFGTRTADFHICTRCGVVPVVTSYIDGHLYAVVSVNAFDGVDPSLLRRSPMHFDGEGTGDRLARRKRNWISDVEFS